MFRHYIQQVELFEPLTHETKCTILKHYDSNFQSLQKDIDSIKEWLKKQPHLTQLPCDEMIRNFLVLSKFSIEKAKKKIDLYYTLRSQLPETFDVLTPDTPEMMKYIDEVYMIPLPKLTDDFYRVNIVKVALNNPELFNPFWFFAWTLDVAHIRLKEDFTVGSEIICDMSNCTLGHMTKLTPTLVKKATTVYEKVFTASIKGLHFINCPPFIDTFLRILKKVASQKIVSRIFVHDTLESLCEKVSKTILPSDYGGEQKSLQELNEILKNKVIEYKDEFHNLYTLRINEKLRPDKSMNDDILGFSGNFKQLEFD